MLALALLLLGVLVHLPLVHGYFLLDDFHILAAMNGFPAERLGDLFLAREPYGIQVDTERYRPLLTLTMWADLQVWGPWPPGFHATNIALHTAVGALLYRLARGTRRAAPIALAFFLVAPIHVEPVAWITARIEVIATLCALIALVAWRSAPPALAYAGALLGLLGALATHELGACVPLILLASDVIEGRRARLVLRHAPFWLVLLGYVALRRALFGELTPDWHPLPLWGSPDEVAGQLSRLLDEAVRFAGLEGGVFPRLLRTAMLGAALLVGWNVWRARPATPRARLTLLGLGIASAALLPLLVPLAYSPRHFYAASVGAALVVGAAGDYLVEHWGRAARVALAGALLVQTPLLAGQIALWRDAGASSGDLAVRLRAAFAAAAADDDVVVLDGETAPPGGFTTWDWAVPFATGPPFMPMAPVGRFVPSRTLYYFGDDWDGGIL